MMRKHETHSAFSATQQQDTRLHIFCRLVYIVQNSDILRSNDLLCQYTCLCIFVMQPGFIPPLFPIARKRPPPDNQETEQERKQKRQRKLDQKEAMRSLRQAKAQCQTDILDYMNKTQDTLEQLLLKTATDVELDPIKLRPLPGRRGKEKAILEDMRLLAAQLSMLAERILETQTDEQQGS